VVVSTHLRPRAQACDRKTGFQRTGPSDGPRAPIGGCLARSGEHNGQHRWTHSRSGGHPIKLRASFLIGWLLALIVAGCGDDPTEPVTLVQFDLRRPIPDPAAPVPLVEPAWTLHWLDHSWDASPDSAKGVWSHGEEATARLHLLGSDALINLVVSTSPELSSVGQTCTVLLNGHDLGTIPVDSAWADHGFTALVPPEALRQGENLLTLRPAVWKHEGQPVALFLRELTVVAQLTAKQRRQWQELLDAPELPAEFAMAQAAKLPPVTAPAERPDVLMVILDATRADHVSCYGYERPTTPQLDALAAGSLVLENCFALAPFTVISVPSLMTGRHWREHGVHGKGQALADSFVTLAEVLADAGYHTLAYSDNPFVSFGTGADQGFHEFTEVWTDPDFGGPGMTPELAEERFLARAEEGFAGKPVFAYLHLMPPHAPYYPGADHDIFSDPAYAGPYDGSAEQLDLIDAEHRELSPADRQQVVDLYDGNLHRIDASLGRILAGWRALERERELLVIVLSDHGEAFGEHGWYQHLSTVYDEMVHVPLVLWPREAWSDLEPARERLLGIDDIFPLLVRRLGVPLPADLSWTARSRGLLAGEVPATAELVLRTSWAAHTFGIRTERYLASFDGLVGQRLYDLREDPGATVNLRAEQPERDRELIGRLRAVLGARQPVIAPAHVLTEQERKALRSLGY
jgi:arylsulfatase A-like enzyme